jgi:hypothetical protein
VGAQISRAWLRAARRLVLGAALRARVCGGDVWRRRIAREIRRRRAQRPPLARAEGAAAPPVRCCARSRRVPLRASGAIGLGADSSARRQDRRRHDRAPVGRIGLPFPDCYQREDAAGYRRVPSDAIDRDRAGGEPCGNTRKARVEWVSPVVPPHIPDHSRDSATVEGSRAPREQCVRLRCAREPTNSGVYAPLRPASPD